MCWTLAFVLRKFYFKCSVSEDCPTLAVMPVTFGVYAHPPVQDGASDGSGDEAVVVGEKSTKVKRGSMAD